MYGVPWAEFNQLKVTDYISLRTSRTEFYTTGTEL